MQPVLIAGQWRAADASDTFQATNPNTREALPPRFPVSSWQDCDAALQAAAEAFEQLRSVPREKIAKFLRDYADNLESAKDALVESAFAESGLAKSPRLADVELPRTVNQLRLAADAVESGDWTCPVIDTQAGIRSCYESLGPVCVFGPNNFPFAFNSVSGGDFAAAIAAGNPVIAKANTSHPETTRLLAEQAFAAVQSAGLPAATIQLLYRTSHDDGERLVSDPRCGATGYTGSRRAGLALKAAADRAGKPIYLELSSVNPVVITPGALRERGGEIIDEFLTSVLMGAGQFCTNPGLVVLLKGGESDAFVEAVAKRFNEAPAGTLLSPAVAKGLSSSIQTLTDAGAERLAGDGSSASDRCAVSNTLLRCSGEQFLRDPETFQTEAFGNASLVVVADDLQQATAVLDSLEGNLTGCLYTATDGSDESDYQQLAFALAPRVGRLLNDKMPTGVAVSPAMNHGGPYPATGHPGFTAVGIPTSIARFAKLTSYDNVRPARLPCWLADKNPTGKTWRSIDGRWTQADVGE
ncbi:aldehyde dehydrogenase (NADP(+)) [Roseimaritima sediminicola]|uniref:aldehyde dehydrogenase (NADP(+)) n=1 Tax=Roseimaritima sediminicola TaxID=2662066 RepID=UPI001F3E74C7|nr:aldehyde dehydrogenase (NADP(+)) [Roseimaritima sediminicola]